MTPSPICKNSNNIGTRTITSLKKIISTKHIGSTKNIN